MFTKKRIATVSVINDLVTDSRVNKTCQVLVECGFEVMLVGRKLPGSLPMPPLPYHTRRMKLLFRSGPLFYFFFNLRLFFYLLFKRSHLLFANDLDTLLPNYLVSKLKGIPLIYDSHELFCEVPELVSTPLKRKIWRGLEGWILPRLKACITVNESIAGIFERKYGVRFHVVRNITPVPLATTPKTRTELGLPADKRIIILQGAGINIHRGAEELVLAMKHVDALLLIIGGGDVWQKLGEIVKTEGLTARVRLISKLPRNELLNYTALADLGISIDKTNNLNYFNSLPNKIFDYIHSGIPVLVSRLPEIEKIVTGFRIGEFIDSHEPSHIAEKITSMLSSELLPIYRTNTLIASRELTWDKEKQKLTALIMLQKV